MPAPIPRPTLLGIAALVSLLLAVGAFAMAWKSEDFGYGDGTAAARAAEEAGRVANTYAIVGFVMLGMTAVIFVLRHLAKRRLATTATAVTLLS